MLLCSIVSNILWVVNKAGEGIWSPFWEGDFLKKCKGWSQQATAVSMEKVC